MKKTRFLKLLSLVLCIVLIAAMALVCTGCSSETPTDSSTTEPTTPPEKPAATVVGEGAHTFTFTVTDLSGKETGFEIHTDKDKVGEALIEHSLIAGDQGAYGLYVKTVNGITLDYNKDGKYWAFYVNGEYAMTGVDVTNITDGASYAFKPE